MHSVCFLELVMGIGRGAGRYVAAKNMSNKEKNCIETVIFRKIFLSNNSFSELMK